MTGALKKDIYTTYTPGSPGVPGTPGSPAIPGQPARTEWRVNRYTYSGQPEYTYHWFVGGAAYHSTNFANIPAGATGVTSTVRSPLDLLSALVGRTLGATEAHYSDTRGLVTIPPYAPMLMILSWTSPWIDVLEQVLVPATPAVPAVPPTPGVPGTPGTMARDFNIGWNAGARSIASAGADCAYTFSAYPSTVGIVTGLNDADQDTGYGEIDFALYLAHGKAQVYENGVAKDDAVSLDGSDTFTIQRKGRTVTYAKNGGVFYTSAKTSTGKVFADASLYMGGDTITAASFGPLDPVGNSAGKLRPLTGHGGRSMTGADGALQPLKAAGYGRPPVGYVPPVDGEPQPDDGGDGYVSPSVYSAGTLEPLTGGSGVAYAGSEASLAPLSAHASGGTLAPEYAIGAGALCYVNGASTSLTGGIASSAGVLQPPWALSADHLYAIGEVSLQPLSGYSGMLSSWSWTGQVDVVMPSPYALEARGTRRPLHAIDAQMPRMSLQAFGGATLRAAMSSAALMATGVGVVVGRVAATMPMPVLQASGTSGAVGTLDATLQESGWSLQAFTGAVIETILHDGFRLEASGTAGAVGKLTATMPLFDLVAHGTADQVGRLDATMPMLQPVASAVLDVLMPMFRLVASGHAVVAVEYEAYTMNLVGPVDLDPRSPHSPSGRELTRYTNFPFDQIVRHGDKYYGVSSTGLYLLGGDTDEGAPIPWAFRTATTDFGTIQRKTVVSAYVGGKVMPTATASIFAGEGGEITYSYPVPPSATNQNYRVRFGRGLKTRYFALEMSDAQGGDVRADSIDFEINTMTRAL